MKTTRNNNFHEELKSQVISHEKVAENDIAEADKEKFTKDDIAKYKELLDFLNDAIGEGNLSNNKDKDEILKKLLDYSYILDRAMTEYIKSVDSTLNVQLDGTFRDPSGDNFNYIRDLRRIYTVHDPKVVHEDTSPIGQIGVDTPFFERLLNKIIRRNNKSELPLIGLDNQLTISGIPNDKRYNPNVRRLQKLAARSNHQEKLLSEEEVEKKSR